MPQSQLLNKKNVDKVINVTYYSNIVKQKGDETMTAKERTEKREKISNRAIEICSMYDKLDKTAQDAIYMAGKLLLAQNETQRESNIRKMLEKA